MKRAAIAAEIRHDYFSQVDSPVKAYLLGLMATDGNIDSRTNSIGLKVSLKDIELANLARDEISPRSAVYTSTLRPLPGYTKQREAAQFTVASAQLKADLGRLGVVPRKTFTLQCPQIMPHLQASFILGCFDGDGMLHLGARPWSWRWCLYSASASFLVAVHAAIHQHTDLDLKKATSKRGLHEIRLNGGKRIDILDAWLHADVPGLSRKRPPPAMRGDRDGHRSEVAAAPQGHGSCLSRG